MTLAKYNGDKQIRQRDDLALSSEEEKHSKNIEDERLHWTDVIPRLRLPTKSIDKWPTLVSLKVVDSPIPDYYVDMDAFAISEQSTLIIPVIPGPHKIAKSDAQDVSANGYASQLRSLIKRSGVYTLSSLALPLISLVLAPFLTHHLSHADYGALAVLTTTISLMVGITQLGLSSAFFRAYNYDYETPQDRLGVISTVIILLSLVTIPTAVAMIIAAPWLAILLLGSPSSSDPVRLVGVIVLLQNLTVPGLAWMRAEERAAAFATLSIANLLVNLGANVVLVGVLHMGISGSLIATGVGFAVIIVCTLPVMLWRVGVHLRFDILKGLLSFGLPGVSTFVSVWVLQLADRFLLARLGSLSQAASYSIAYSLGSVLGAVVLSPFQLAWPSAMFSIAKRKNAVHVFQLVFRWYSIILFFTTYALTIVATFVLYLFFPPGYDSAAPIIPVVAVSIMFYGVYNYLTLGIGITRKTWFAFVLTAIAAIINVVANLVLIPLYGSVGAALSTLIAYALLAVIGYFVNQRIYPVPFEIGRFFVGLFSGVALYVGSSFLAQAQGLYVTLGISFCALCLYTGSLVALGKLRTSRPNLEDKNGYSLKEVLS